MAEFSNKDWAMYIKMDYAQNLRKDLKMDLYLSESIIYKKYKMLLLINEMNQSIIKLMICINEKSNL